MSDIALGEMLGLREASLEKPAFLSRRLASRLGLILVILIVTLVLATHARGNSAKLHQLPGLLNDNVQSYFQRGYKVPVYAGGIPEPHKQYEKNLIIASVAKDNLTWLYDGLPEVKTTVYVADDPNAEFTVPVNKGNEVMVYLTYLIDHYDRLPDVMIFLHAHQFTYHNPHVMGANTLLMVDTLSPQRVIREGYMNMNCGSWQTDTCPATIRPKEIYPSNYPSNQFAKVFTELFPLNDVPDVLSQHCCGQFALSRERVLQIPQKQLVKYRQWMLDTRYVNKESGYFWEYLWQFVLTGRPVYCPDKNVCFCDGFGYCFGGKSEFRDYHTAFAAKERIREDIRRMEERTAAGENLTDAEVRQMDASKRVVGGLITQIDLSVKAALERGKDPKHRADEAGRPWKEGDGFN